MPREIKDDEEVEWDVDLGEELRQRGREKK